MNNQQEPTNSNCEEPNAMLHTWKDEYKSYRGIEIKHNGKTRMDLEELKQ